MNKRCSIQLSSWFQTPLGQRLLSEEASAMQQILPHLFGYHLLQIGNFAYGSLLESSLIRHRCVLSQSAQMVCHTYSSVHAFADALPFAHDSVDVVVLPHILEFEEKPDAILREVERILIPEGHLVILGFNPLSLWRYSFSEASCCNSLPVVRLKDWLALLGFDLEKQETFFFALPFNNSLKPYTIFLEKIGSHWANHFGLVYLLVAKKRVATLTPIGPKWMTQPMLITEAVSTPRETLCVK